MLSQHNLIKNHSKTANIYKVYKLFLSSLKKDGFKRHFKKRTLFNKRYYG